MVMSGADARMEFMVLESRAENFGGPEFDATFTNAGLPPEVVLRLKELWEATCRIGEKILRVGKLILMELARFVRENPNLAVGVALGAGVGALVAMVPVLGPFLAPLAALLGVVIGSVAGSRLDRGAEASEGTVGIAQEAIIIARKFFELFAAIFSAVSTEMRTE